MIKTGRIQCAILESLPATIDEIEEGLTPSAIHVVYTAILTLYLRQWVNIDAETKQVTVTDSDAVRDILAWKLPKPYPLSRTKRTAPCLFHEKLMRSLGKRGGRSPRSCGDLWAAGIKQTHQRLLHMERSGWIERSDHGRAISLTEKGQKVVGHWFGAGAFKHRRK
tara:strand:+ start:632 stop:1129 length:498 start_codon:yes stop_codon:yes gene_type:complete